MVEDALLSRFLIFGRKELMQHAVQAGEFADFIVRDQVDAVETTGDGFEASTVAMVAAQIAKQSGGDAGALRSSRRPYAANCGM